MTPYTDVCPKAANSNSRGAQEEHDCSNAAIAMQMEPHEAGPRGAMKYKSRTGLVISDPSLLRAVPMSTILRRRAQHFSSKASTDDNFALSREVKRLD